MTARISATPILTAVVGLPVIDSHVRRNRPRAPEKIERLDSRLPTPGHIAAGQIDFDQIAVEVIAVQGEGHGVGREFGVAAMRP
jgi:hypothetical protein